MKKTVAMLVMLISAVLYAEEDENVKAVVVQDWQLAAQGKDLLSCQIFKIK